MKLNQLIKSLDNYKIYFKGNLLNKMPESIEKIKSLDFEVKGISCNSKDMKADSIFLAVKGAKLDGNKFIPEAINNGAKAVVVQSGYKGIKNLSKQVRVIEVKDIRRAVGNLSASFYGRPSSKIKVAGITGTNGKTTISYLIEAILKEAGFCPAVIGTINYRFKQKVISAKNTTPGPIEMQSMLQDMHKQGVDYAVMEVSSHALDQKRTAGIKFHSAIFTNLTQDHLDYHKTLENYFQAKARLFKDIDKDSFCIINNDDKYASRLKRLTNAEIFTYGINEEAHVFATDINMDMYHTEFRLVVPSGYINLNTRLIGYHNIYNILASAAWAFKSGISLDFVKKAVQKIEFVPGRLERIDTKKDFSVFVDYAHTEDALNNVIGSLRKVCRKKLITVFGCGGERDKTKRPKMGNVVSKLADYAIITNDNPRSEDPERIIADIKKGIRKNNYCVVPERFEAIKKSLAIARAGDVVLVAGKGHEDYQILKDKIVHFDDREVIKECLKLMNY